MIHWRLIFKFKPSHRMVLSFGLVIPFLNQVLPSKFKIDRFEILYIVSLDRKPSFSSWSHVPLYAASPSVFVLNSPRIVCAMVFGIVFKFVSMVVLWRWKLIKSNLPRPNHVLLPSICEVLYSLQAFRKIILHLIYLFVARISSVEVYVVWESTRNKSIGLHHAVVD